MILHSDYSISTIHDPQINFSQLCLDDKMVTQIFNTHDFRKGTMERAVTDKKDHIVVKVKVVPGSRKFEFPFGYDEWRNAITVRVSSPAEDNRANKELIRELKKILNTDVEILSGLKNPLKTLKIGMKKDDFIRVLSGEG